MGNRLGKEDSTLTRRLVPHEWVCKRSSQSTPGRLEQVFTKFSVTRFENIVFKKTFPTRETLALPEGRNDRHM